ncbi:inaD-like protein [Notothenia coriiceps]|uniref:InaD-like protein n=1 Tax=Notothenia coriiceps TaxID=8208 RepID=A0A6I9N5Q0_9TELE|nr:PREDICTED: inaD-like protein [Notothenia coriiceps]
MCLQAEGRERSSLESNNTHLPVPKGFGDGSILPEDLLQKVEIEEEEEPELILDGGLPRYTSFSLASDLLSPMEEGREMAVDEDVEVVEDEEEKEVKMQEKVEENTGLLPRKPPPSWEEWKLNSSSWAGAAEETWSREEQEELSDREEEELSDREEEEDLQRSDHESIVSSAQRIPGIPDFRDSEADSELTLTDTDTESIKLTNSKRRKRRSQGGASLSMRGGQGDLPEREDGEGEETPAFSHWGLPRSPDAAVPPARQQQTEQFVAWGMGVILLYGAPVEGKDPLYCPFHANAVPGPVRS